MKCSIKVGSLILAALVLTLPLLVACSSEDNNDLPTEDGGNATAQPEEDVVIKIGHITDLTGGGAHAMSFVNSGLADAVQYFNENNLIPGVEIKILTYDNEYETSREISGYKSLMGDNVDILIGNMPQTAIILKPFVNDDTVMFFAMPYTEEGFQPPGYSFSLNIPTQSFGPTMMQWIAENDPDFPKDRPAKIGATNWDEPQSRSIFEAAEKYANDNPDLFEWEGSLYTGRVFKWDVQVETLKDCDYVFPPMAGLVNFAKEYRTAGCTAQFLGTDGHAAFMGLIDAAHLWDELDGMFFGLPYGYWTDETEMIDLANEYVRANHNNADKIIENGTSYLGPFISYQGMLQMIAGTVERVGAENFTSQAFYDFAQSYSANLDGRPWGFGETKRNAIDSLAIYELSETNKDLFRADPEWLPLVYVE